MPVSDIYRDLYQTRHIIHRPIARGIYHVELAHTNKDAEKTFLKVNNRCYFSAPHQRRARALYIFQNTDRFGNVFYKIRVMVVESRVSRTDETKLVAPFLEWRTYRINLKTQTCIQQIKGYDGPKSIQPSSPDSSIQMEDFKALLFFYTQLAEYEIEKSKPFW